MGEVPSQVNLLVAAEVEDEVKSALEGLEFEEAGAPRGVADAVQLFIIAMPSAAALLLLLEKLRRLRLPRTYIRARAGEIEIWTDEDLNDGRVFVARDDGSVEELPDAELSPQPLLDALGLGKSDD